MRVALLTRRFDARGGGTERDLITTIEYLKRGGHQVSVYAGELRTPWDGCDVREVGAPRGLGRTLRLIHFAYAAPALARRDDPDLIVSFARVFNAGVMRSGGSAHISYLRAVHRWRPEAAAAAMWLNPYHLSQRLIEARGFRSPDLKLGLAVSNLVRDELMREFDLPADKVATLYNGIDLEKFRPPAGAEWRMRMRRKMAVPRTSALVVFVGNGFARKGLGYLLEAWPQINGSPYLIVIGKDRRIENYKRRARKLGVQERILFLGDRQTVDKFLQIADALVLPSLFEPFGNVVMEAMACGCPALTSVYTGVAELLPRELKRFTVEEPTNPGEISARLEALINSPPEFRELARATAERFTWDRYGENLLNLIQSCQ